MKNRKPMVEYNMYKLEMELTGCEWSFARTLTKIRATNTKKVLYFHSLKAALQRLTPGGWKGKSISELIAVASPPELTKELKEKLVREAQSVWDTIAYDYIRLDDEGTNSNTSCSGEDARDGVADRMESREFYELSRADQDAILIEALPHNSYCL